MSNSNKHWGDTEFADLLGVALVILAIAVLWHCCNVEERANKAPAPTPEKQP